MLLFKGNVVRLAKADLRLARGDTDITFDHVIPPTSNQEDVYQLVGPASVAGINICLSAGSQRSLKFTLS